MIVTPGQWPGSVEAYHCVMGIRVSQNISSPDQSFSLLPSRSQASVQGQGRAEGPDFTSLHKHTK